MSRKPLQQQPTSRKPIHRPVKLHRKVKGEWAEVEFMSKAIRFGLIVARPWGDSAPFDFIVQSRRGNLYRIQVKSTWSTHGGCYSVHVAGSQDRPYSLRDFEFLAAYVVPERAWYIIPLAEVVKRKVLNFYPHRPVSRGKLEKHREAWHLLK